jgi:glycosyltransferase involved in cell wall biosynthesis
MRILIATDAWLPQVNGVVTTLRNTIRELEKLGHTVALVTHEGFRTLPCPSYPEIRLAIAPGSRAGRKVDEFEPDAVHIATEGPLGLAVRRHCLSAGVPFTTAFHTQFPEFVHARCRLPVGITYRWLRWFHAPATAVMVATPDIHHRLAIRSFINLALWSRGVDTELFAPAKRAPFAGRRPIFLYAGRVAIEKNIEAFLRLDLPGTKWVVGDGPARARLETRFPDVVFHGMKHGRNLAHYFQQADVFVFPSCTDTFGLVLIEAMACGTPVAAYAVSGPIDVVRDSAVGVLGEDLRSAALAALELDRDAVRAYALQFSWEAATRQFIANLTPDGGRSASAADMKPPLAVRAAGKASSRDR